LSTRVTNKRKERFSTLASESPVDLYWLNRTLNEAATSDKEEGEHTIICNQFWDEFLIAAKATYKLNPEADLFDAFNFIREQFLGGWSMLEDSTFIKDIDEQIEREYQKGLRRA